jgi:catechol 2,3-dioxygenase-like lactoylglutathione lyase family enzyme
MQPRVDIITLGVPDLEIARTFYVQGLGWTAALDVPGEVVFIQIGHGLLLGLFGADDLDADSGISDPPEAAPANRRPAAPMSLAQVVETEEEVGAVLQRAEEAGGTILKTPQRAEFGGFHGYFADPCGFRWEIATNSGWHVEPDGAVSIGPIVDPD